MVGVAAGLIGRGGVAPVGQEGDDLDLVVFHFAVQGFAGGLHRRYPVRQQARRAVAEAGERLERGRRSQSVGHGEVQGVGSGVDDYPAVGQIGRGKRRAAGVGPDDLLRWLPNSVVVPVDPAVEHAGGRGGDDDRFYRGRAAGIADEVVAALEHHAVLGGIARAADDGVRRAADRTAQIDVGIDQVAGAVGQRRGADGIRRIGIHRGGAEVEPGQRDAEARRAVVVIRLERVPGPVLDAGGQIDRIRAVRRPDAGCRHQRDDVICRVIAEEVVAAADQFGSILEELARCRRLRSRRQLLRRRRRAGWRNREKPSRRPWQS